MDVMRRIEGEEAADRMRWLSGPRWPVTYGTRDGATGYDRTDGWAAAVWVLHAMYERPESVPGLTHHELRQQAIAAGMIAPDVVDGLNLDERTTTTGVALGFTYQPGPPWRRLTWSELGRRDGFDFWAVEGHWPELRYTAQRDWADSVVMPERSRPRILPTSASSWPACILPPPEGSLDEESLTALIAVLARHTSPDTLRDSVAYYSPVTFLQEGATVFVGDLSDVPEVIASQMGSKFAPNNMWPSDRSWLSYTDCDLSATRVNGSQLLVDAICADPTLETVRCGGMPAAL